MKTRNGFVSNSSSASFIIKYVKGDKVAEKVYGTVMYNCEIDDFGQEAMDFLARVVHDGNFISCRVEED
jgi:hypothetical protein